MVLEGQMTWIVHIISAIMKGRLSSSTAECQVRPSLFSAVCDGGLLHTTAIEDILGCIDRLLDEYPQGLVKQLLCSEDSPSLVLAGRQPVTEH